MKKFMKAVIIMIVSLGLLVGCGGNDEASSGEYSVLLLIPGNLGDKSFFDAANKGMDRVKDELNFDTKVIEMGVDESKWEPSFLDAVEGGYDLIISGNAASDMMNDIAKENPEQKFLNFDNSGTEAAENVYSVTYGTNEGAFLAGAFASLVTTSDMEKANEDAVIGFLGGMDIPGINDFMVGYIQGALHVNEDVKVISTYAGSFSDPAAGKELSLSIYKSGADIAFNVAGQTGLGLIDAAAESDKYAIGVDSDQAALYIDSEPDKANLVLTSVVKQIDQVIVDSAKKAQEGNLEFGKHELLGISADAVGLADNEIYKNVPQEIRDEVQKISDAIVSGEIKVKSGFEMTTEDIASYRDSVRP